MEEQEVVYQVVVNHEEQYSIWPIHKPVPHGWQLAGKSGSKPECLEYIGKVWVDMTPLSLRKAKELSKTAAPVANANQFNL